jgi:hypothetical protein
VSEGVAWGSRKKMKMKRREWIAQSLNCSIKRRNTYTYIQKRGFTRRFLKKPRTFSLIVSLTNSLLN